MSRPAHRRSPETAAIIAIDKDRRSIAQKARDRAVVDAARTSTLVAIMAVPEPQRVQHMEGMLDTIRAQLTVCLDAAGASSIIAKRAEQAIISGPNARARAEQLFSGGAG